MRRVKNRSTCTCLRMRISFGNLCARSIRIFRIAARFLWKPTPGWKSTPIGEATSADLRHEVTHAYLHSVLPNIPLWLDEGLAEYFEVPRGRHGLNRDHLAQLLAKEAPGNSPAALPATSPLEEPDRPASLARLESFHPGQSLCQEDYAECWAWVHFLLQSSPEAKLLLREYLYRLHVDGSTAPLSSRLAWRFGLTADQLADRVAEHVFMTAQNARHAESAGTDLGREGV